MTAKETRVTLILLEVGFDSSRNSSAKVRAKSSLIKPVDKAFVFLV